MTIRWWGQAVAVSGVLTFGVPHDAASQSPAEEALVGAEAVGWSVGSSDAPVLVIEFSDLSCPYCATFHEGTRKALREEFVENGQVRWITLSYDSGQYRFSGMAARGAECAGRQDGYEAYSGSMLRRRDEWIGGPARTVESTIAAVADALDLDGDAFAACLGSTVIDERLETVRDMAARAGVRGTPTWFVDGFAVMGALPLGYARSFIVDRLEGGDPRREGRADPLEGSTDPPEGSTDPPGGGRSR